MADPAPPRPGHPVSLPRPFGVAARDGLELVCETWEPSGERRARVLLVHGFGEHKGRHRTLARELAAASCTVHLFDLRGHGESDGRRGHVDRFADYRNDLLRVADEVVPAPEPGRPAPPLVLLGHSLGGLIALDAALHHPERFAGRRGATGSHPAGGGARASEPAFAAVVLCSPFLAPAFRLPPWARVLARASLRFFPQADFDPRLDPEGLSRDPEVVRAYREDPMVVRRITAACALEILAAQDEVFARAGELHAPTLLLVGSADPVAAPGRARELFEQLGSPSKRLEVYESFLHELFHEPGRGRVLADLLGWLDGLTAAGPSPPPAAP
ncbi:MAG: lysophospholipase [Thermoanaerobaculia bacterium]